MYIFSIHYLNIFSFPVLTLDYLHFILMSVIFHSTSLFFKLIFLAFFIHKKSSCELNNNLWNCNLWNEVTAHDSFVRYKKNQAKHHTWSYNGIVKCSVKCRTCLRQARFRSSLDRALESRGYSRNGKNERGERCVSKQCIRHEHTLQ